LMEPRSDSACVVYPKHGGTVQNCCFPRTLRSVMATELYHGLNKTVVDHSFEDALLMEG